MKALFLSGDKRQLEVIKNLNKKNIEIDLIGFETIDIDIGKKRKLSELNISDYDLIFFPINGISNQFTIQNVAQTEEISLPINLLIGSKETAKIFSGIRTPSLTNLLEHAKRKAVFLMEDKEVQQQNAIPTVEGIVGDLVSNIDTTIDGSNIFLIGYGNVGKVLAKYLKNMNSNLFVGIIDQMDESSLKNNNLPYIYTNNQEHMLQILNWCDVIINTVPKQILTRDYLSHVRKESYLLDIASAPYGIDFKSAENFGLKSKILSGIPGKTAPITAGNILVKKINLLLKEKEND